MLLFKKFLRRNEGLVTIEWVGIAAVMVLAAIGITTYIMQGVDEAGGTIATGVSSIDAGSPVGAGTFDGKADIP